MTANVDMLCTGDDWSDCFMITGAVSLPKSPFLGFSALTGAVSDNHEYVHFVIILFAFVWDGTIKITYTYTSLFSSSIVTVTSYSAILSPKDAPRDKIRSKLPSLFGKASEASGSWSWFFIKLFLFGGLCAGGWFGYQTYLKRQRYGMGGFGMGGGYGRSGFSGAFYDSKRFWFTFWCTVYVFQLRYCGLICSLSNLASDERECWVQGVPLVFDTPLHWSCTFTPGSPHTWPCDLHRCRGRLVVVVEIVAKTLQVHILYYALNWLEDFNLLPISKSQEFAVGFEEQNSSALIFGLEHGAWRCDIFSYVTWCVLYLLVMQGLNEDEKWLLLRKKWRSVCKTGPGCVEYTTFGPEQMGDERGEAQRR